MREPGASRAGAGGVRLGRVRRALLIIVVLFLAGEAGVRLIGRRVDGNTLLLGRRLRPFRLPSARLEAALADYLGPESYIEYSPTLGWRPKPLAGSADGWYQYNAQRVRVGDPGVPFSELPADGTTRIVLVGDSFVHGDDVPFAASLGACLAAELEARAFDAEVINLGVPGYGMDQALLRFREEGRGFHPHVVIFGLQVENFSRNLNLLRGVYWWRTGIPFTKPRFVLQGGELTLVNQPTVPPDRLPDLLRAPDQWEWLEHETYYDPGDYANLFWRHSRFLAALETAIKGLRREGARTGLKHSPESEGGALGLAIVQELVGEAQRCGARCLAVHIPIRSTLITKQEGGELPYADLLAAVAARVELVDPITPLLEEAQRDGLAGMFAAGSGHYSGRANAVLARALADRTVE